VQPVAATLIVNVYERTYRAALTPGTFDAIVADNRVQIEDRWVLINNVDDSTHARRMAQALMESGEISGFALVEHEIDRALKVTGLTRRALRRRPYFLNYGLVMSITGSEPYVLGWDAETRLTSPADWLTPGIELLESDANIFSVCPRWPATRDTLDQETVGRQGPWALNYGFTDQVFLVRRREIASPIYRALAPASMVRSANHPFSFEARLESHQRARGLFRATHTQVSFVANDLPPVIERQLGGYTWRERLQRRLLALVGAGLARLGSSDPRLRLP